MLYLYKFQNRIILADEKVFNLNYKFLRKFDLDILNHPLKSSKSTCHPINTNLIPTNFGFILIMDRHYDVKLFEQFDVLKDYPIIKTDFVFEIYKINKTTKVFPYPFRFDNFFIQCPSCNDITIEPILMCKNCFKPMCTGCNIFDDYICDTCNGNNILF